MIATSVYCGFALVLPLLLCYESTFGESRRFYIDYEKDEFVKDGKAFRYVSGSLHYFRVPRPYWRDRVRKMKAAGLNAISFYVEWSFHEPYSGVYNFEEQADIEYFLTISKQENMMVLIRPGPFISAERDFGGLPYWLLKDKTIQLRSSDPKYTTYVKRWFSVLMPKIVSFLYGNGGNVIMVQLENEYGHNDLGSCDKEYMLWLRDLVHNYVGDRAQLYTTDECDLSYLRCGHVPNVYSTVDFAPIVNVTECFGFMRRVQERGPLVNSEFYVGWIGYWDEPRPVRRTEDIIRVMNGFLAANVSFNIFLFHGGTNFGFTSGATADPNATVTGRRHRYKPQLTSYDFTSPLDEAGDPTEKYHAIRRALEAANFPVAPTPRRAPKGGYGTVSLSPVVSLFDRASRRLKPVVNDVPLCFEDMDLNHGLALYETDLPPVGKSVELPLVVGSLGDRAIVFLNHARSGIMVRSPGNATMGLTVPAGNNHKLSILVENQGRINDKRFLADRKGILSNVTLGEHVLGPWTMTGYPLNETSWLDSENVRPNVRPPAFYRGVFVVPQNDKHTKPLDTFLDTSGWSKGVAFVNGINLGRYWPAVGPQITLYVPAPFMVPGVNVIVMAELERAPEDFTVTLVDRPRLDW